MREGSPTLSVSCLMACAGVSPIQPDATATQNSEARLSERYAMSTVTMGGDGYGNDWNTACGEAFGESLANTQLYVGCLDQLSFHRHLKGRLPLCVLSMSCRTPGASGYFLSKFTLSI